MSNNLEDLEARVERLLHESWNNARQAALRAEAERDELQARLDAVTDLHCAWSDCPCCGDGCKACTEGDFFVPWPCPTFKAATERPNEDDN